MDDGAPLVEDGEAEEECALDELFAEAGGSVLCDGSGADPASRTNSAASGPILVDSLEHVFGPQHGCF